MTYYDKHGTEIHEGDVYDINGRHEVFSRAKLEAERVTPSNWNKIYATALSRADGTPEQRQHDYDYHDWCRHCGNSRHVVKSIHRPDAMPYKGDNWWRFEESILMYRAPLVHRLRAIAEDVGRAVLRGGK